jgi:hypothetical protein
MPGEVFQRGETIALTAKVTDEDGKDYDPVNGCKIWVYDSNGSAVDTGGAGGTAGTAMTPTSITGEYKLYLTTEATDVLGWWRYRVKSDDTDKFTIADSGFRLEA